MADLQSIIDRAASVETLAEECLLLRDVLALDSRENMFPHVTGTHVLAMRNIVSDVLCGLSPADVLLGVVVTLVPPGVRFDVSSFACGTRYGCVWGKAGNRSDNHSTAALSLLSALCRSLQAQGSATHD